MRVFSTIFLVVVVGLLIFWAIQTKAPESVQSAKVGDEAATTTAATTTPSVPSNKQVVLTSFNFTGYGPGKSHLGTFKETAVSDVSFDSNGVPTAGKFTIKTASVSTGIEGLDKHLCTPDFFDCAANPEIIFNLKSITPTAATSTYAVSGELTFNGRTQPIQFNSETSNTAFTADLKFDTTFFNFKYIGIDKDVRVQFSGSIN